MASIKKLANGTYQATISCGRDGNGKQIRKYVTKSSLQECKAAARALEQEYEEGTMVNYKNVRLSVWMDEWLKLNKNRLSPSTYVLYKTYIESHYKPALGALKLSQINEIHIKRFLNEKMGTHAVSTVRKLLFILRRMLQDVLKGKNPAKDIEVPKKVKPKHHIVTDEEFNRIYELYKDTAYEPIILLSAWGGLRRGEIFALKWNDIDEKETSIRIDQARTISENGYVEKKPKSDNGIRSIVVPKYLIGLLLSIRAKSKVISIQDDDYIFPEEPDNFTQRFQYHMKKNNMGDIRFHDLRHYHASWLYKNNIPDLYAASRLGHDIQTLKQIYQHLDVGKKKELDNNIIKLIEKPGR